MNFDERALTWDDNPERLERAKTIAQTIKNVYFAQIGDKRAQALEFGCGTGLLSFYLQDIYNSVTMIDSSKGMVEVLENKIQDADIKNMLPVLSDDITELDYYEKFDVVYMSMTLHHIMNIDLLFSTLNRMMKPHGLFFIADLIPEDGSFHSEHKDFSGYKGFEKLFLDTKLKSNDFEEIAYDICYIIKKDINGETKNFPVFLYTARKK